MNTRLDRDELEAENTKLRADSLQSQLAAAQEAIKDVSLDQIEAFMKDTLIYQHDARPLEPWAVEENRVLISICKVAAIIAAAQRGESQ